MTALQGVALLTYLQVIHPVLTLLWAFFNRVGLRPRTASRVSWTWLEEDSSELDTGLPEASVAYASGDNEDFDGNIMLDVMGTGLALEKTGRGHYHASTEV